jgi:hypothetical protein
MLKESTSIQCLFIHIRNGNGKNLKTEETGSILRAAKMAGYDLGRSQKLWFPYLQNDEFKEQPLRYTL